MRNYKNEFTYNKTLLHVIRDQEAKINELKELLYHYAQRIGYLEGLLEPLEDEDPFYEYSAEGDTSQDLNH